MNQTQNDFYQVFTELQCYILANMNKGAISGVTATHYNIIDYIYRNRGTTGRQIAKAFGVSQAAVSKQLKFLLDKALIVQEQSAEDRRIYHLTVSDSGKFIVDNSEDFRKHTVLGFSKVLNNQELKTLSMLLKRALNYTTQE